MGTFGGTRRQRTALGAVLLAVLGAWLGHGLEALRLGGIAGLSSAVTGPVHLYMLPVGAVLALSLTLLGIQGWRLWRELGRRVHEARGLLRRAWRSGAGASPPGAAPPPPARAAAAGGLGWLCPLLAVAQIGLYVLQENIEAVAGGGTPRGWRYSAACTGLWSWSSSSSPCCSPAWSPWCSAASSDATGWRCDANASPAPCSCSPAAGPPPWTPRPRSGSARRTSVSAHRSRAALRRCRPSDRPAPPALAGRGDVRRPAPSQTFDTRIHAHAHVHTHHRGGRHRGARRPGTARTALAHEVSTVGPYTIALGWLHEPAYVGFDNAVQVLVKQGDTAFTDITDKDLTVEVSLGTQKMDAMPLVPSADPDTGVRHPRRVRDALHPHRPWQLHLPHQGVDQGDPDRPHRDRASDKTFNEVQDANAVEWPNKLPSSADLATKVDKQTPRISAVQASATQDSNASKDDANRPRRRHRRPGGRAGAVVGFVSLTRQRQPKD